MKLPSIGLLALMLACTTEDTETGGEKMKVG